MDLMIKVNFNHKQVKVSHKDTARSQEYLLKWRVNIRINRNPIFNQSLRFKEEVKVYLKVSTEFINLLNLLLFLLTNSRSFISNPGNSSSFFSYTH